MAKDLKDKLDKILKAKGNAHYNFAYGTGKREDGKGEGGLMVSASKKLKKEDLAEECACSQFYEGKCWGSADGGTIYFGGKSKLGGTIISKMKITAKVVTGKQFEFAVPTPEEEQRAEKAGGTEQKEGETEGEDTGAAKEMYEGLRSTVVPDLAKLLKSDPTTAAKIQQLVEAAAKQASGGDYAKGATFLDQAATALASAASGKRTTEAKETAPKGKVGLEVLRNELHTLRVQAVSGMVKLVAELKKTEHQHAAPIAKAVTQLAQNMPAELEAILQQYDKAVNANDTAAVTKQKAEVMKSVTGWMGFLDKNKNHIRGAETNPWGIAIQIDKPIRASLAAILKVAH